MSIFTAPGLFNRNGNVTGLRISLMHCCAARVPRTTTKRSLAIKQNPPTIPCVKAMWSSPVKAGSGCWPGYIQTCLHWSSEPSTKWDSSPKTICAHRALYHIIWAWHHCNTYWWCALVSGSWQSGFAYHWYSTISMVVEFVGKEQQNPTCGWILPFLTPCLPNWFDHSASFILSIYPLLDSIICSYHARLQHCGICTTNTDECIPNPLYISSLWESFSHFTP